MDSEITNFVPFRFDLVPGSALDIFQDDQAWLVCYGVPDDTPERSTRLALFVKGFAVIVQDREVNAGKPGNQDIRIFGDFLDGAIGSLTE